MRLSTTKPTWLGGAASALGGATLVTCGLMACFSAFHGETRQRLASPDGHVVAQVIGG
jgi:hypothetical protein